MSNSTNVDGTGGGVEDESPQEPIAPVAVSFY
jgi:hypothetical protein